MKERRNQIHFLCISHAISNEDQEPIIGSCQDPEFFN